MRLRMLQLLLILLLSYCTTNAIKTAKETTTAADEEQNRTTASQIVPVMILHPAENRPALINRITEKEIRCVADMTYKEALGENLDGWMAVIHVAFNRMENQEFPKNACDVIYQRKGKVCQYSWVCDHGARRIARNSDEYRQMLILVRTIASVPERYNIDPTNGSLYFKKAGTRNQWFTQNLKFVKQIGEHQFFVES